MTSKGLIISSFVLLLSVICVNCQNSCVSGQCISIHDCPQLAQLLTRVLKPNEVRMLNNAKCTSPLNPRSNSYVCCPEAAQPTSAPPTCNAAQICEPSDGQGNVLPADCGEDLATPKIIFGEQADLDEYPWMAVLEYQRRNGGWSTNCGGFLINKRYVLTAAHCVAGNDYTNLGRLINIRLGEYNLTSPNPDCLTIDGVTECNEPIQNMGVEEIIPHESYVPIERSGQKRDFDIALIRLAGNARINRFVAPICLPTATFRGTPSGRSMVVAGWGRTENGTNSPVKLKANVNAHDFAQCQETYQARRVVLEDSQMCANHPISDSCRGDSGGPLMAQQNNRWIAEGIVSFGINCGGNQPSVYTKVQQFLPWIRANMKP